MNQLETTHLVLRQPNGADLPAYGAYCQSARTRFTGGPYTAAQAFEKTGCNDRPLGDSRIWSTYCH